MFKNRRTGDEAAELRAYPSEDEADAKRRLEAMGWQFGGVDYEFENSKFTLKTTVKEEVTQDE